LCDDVHTPDLTQTFHHEHPQALGLVTYIRRLEVTEIPQLMSFQVFDNPTTLRYSQPFITGDGTQHVQGTGTTLWPQDEYELSWEGNDPPHFVHVISHGDTPLSWTNALAIPAAMHDDDESAMPTVCTSGRVMRGDREAELHEGGTDTITARHPNPQPILLTRSDVTIYRDSPYVCVHLVLWLLGAVVRSELCVSWLLLKT
jgi:hypothetical protein